MIPCLVLKGSAGLADIETSSIAPRSPVDPHVGSVEDLRSYQDGNEPSRDDDGLQEQNYKLYP
jgi:hypothetical protein